MEGNLRRCSSWVGAVDDDDGIEKEKEKKIVVCIWVDKGHGGGKRCSDWYMVEDLYGIQHEKVEETTGLLYKSQAKKMDSWPNPDPKIQLCTPIALPSSSSIYYLGGSKYPTTSIHCDSVSYFNFNHHLGSDSKYYCSSGLKSASSMKAVRIFPYAVAHNGKIYAFKCGAEVFHPTITGTGGGGGFWESFSGPPHDLLTDCARYPLSDPAKNRIIVYFRNNKCIYAYHTSNDYDHDDRWELLATNFAYPWSNCALVDDIIIIHCHNHPDPFIAYDLVNGRDCSFVWSLDKNNKRMLYGLFEDKDCPWDFDSLFHLGHGKLCMFRSYSRTDTHMIVDVITFVVHYTKGSSVITASSPVFKSFYIEGGHGVFNYLLL